MTPPPSAPRTLLAAALAFATVWLAGGALRSFAYTLPILVLISGWTLSSLSRIRARPLLRRLTEVLLLVPAMNARFTETAMGAQHAMWLDARLALEQLLAISAAPPRATTPLLLGAAVGGWVLLGRTGGLLVSAALGAALGAQISQVALSQAARAAAQWQDPQLQAWTLVATSCGTLGLLAAVVGARLSPGPVGHRAYTLLGALAALLAAAAATPPIQHFAALQPSPASQLAVPLAAPGPVSLAAPLSPDDPMLGHHLDQVGQVSMRSWPPECPEESPQVWLGRFHASAILELPAQAPVARLAPALPILYSHGVGVGALLGRARSYSLPLGSRIGWPIARFQLDAPPLAWDLHLDALGLHPLEPRDSPVCALSVEPDVRVDWLYQTLRGLQTRSPPALCPGGVVLRIGDRSRPWACARSD